MSTARAQHLKRRLFTPRAALLAFVLLAMVFSSAYPLRRYVVLRGAISALEQESRALDTQIDDLAKQKTRLMSDAEVIRRAREDLGMVKPGEVPFAILDAEQPPPATGEVFRRPEPDRGGPLLSRWWTGFTRAFRSVL